MLTYTTSSSSSGEFQTTTLHDDFNFIAPVFTRPVVNPVKLASDFTNLFKAGTGTDDKKSRMVGNLFNHVAGNIFSLNLAGPGQVSGGEATRLGPLLDFLSSADAAPYLPPGAPKILDGIGTVSAKRAVEIKQITGGWAQRDKTHIAELDKAAEAAASYSLKMQQLRSKKSGHKPQKTGF